MNNPLRLPAGQFRVRPCSIIGFYPSGCFRAVCICLLAMGLAALLYGPGLQAQGAQTETTENPQAADSLDAQLVRRLQAIRESLQNKREQVRNLVEEVQ